MHPSATSPPDRLWPDAELEAALARTALRPRVHYFDSTGSTNDEARRLAERGAPEGSLVLADEQTAGRGRLGRTWITPAGQAIAMSLVLRPNVEASRLARLTMIAGLAVAEALEADLRLRPALKWPNDVLLSGKKVAGILVEAAWSGERLEHAVVGIGINVRPGAVPPLEQVLFPATSVEAEFGAPVRRAGLLAAVLLRLDGWYARLPDDRLVHEWSARLAFKGQAVRVSTPAGDVIGVALGVDEAGALIVQTEAGESRRVQSGDVHLRPIP